MNTYTELLTRIAAALERQCEQHDSWRAIQAAEHSESIALRQSQDAAVLAAARADHADLLRKLDESIEFMRSREAKS